MTEVCMAVDAASLEALIGFLVRCDLGVLVERLVGFD